MTKEEKYNLYVFGYGLSLIIPYLMFFKSLHLGFSFRMLLVLLTGFGLVLFCVTKISNLKPIVNSWIFIVHAFILFSGATGRFGIVAIGLVVCVSMILAVTIYQVERLKPIYLGWMKVAQGIGAIITSFILCIVYYTLFAFVGIILRVLKKDLLDRYQNKEVESYWITRESIPFKKENYTKQF